MQIKEAVYNLAESPLLSASLPPRLSGFFCFVPGRRGVFWGGSWHRVAAAPGLGQLGFEGLGCLGCFGVFMHGEKVGNWVWQIRRSGFNANLGLFGI